VLSVMGAALLISPLLLMLGAVGVTYVAFVALGVAGGLFATANGSLWAQLYGTDGLGSLQSIGSAGQIAGAAAGPLPLALSLSLTGSYVPGLALLAGLALAGTIGGSWPRGAEPQ